MPRGDPSLHSRTHSAAAAPGQRLPREIIAFDIIGRMYVLETTAAGVDPPLSDPSAGRLVRVERDGSLTPILTGLAFPTALVAGRDDAFYVTNCGYGCNDRSNFPAALPSLRAGQVLKVKLADANAARQLTA